MSGGKYQRREGGEEEETCRLLLKISIELVFIVFFFLFSNIYDFSLSSCLLHFLNSVP